MNNTGRILFKMGITRPNEPAQALFLERLHHVLRSAKGRDALRRLLEQYELPVIQLRRQNRPRKSHSTQRPHG